MAQLYTPQQLGIKAPSGGFKTISLSRGKQAIVDVEDYDWLNQWNWSCGAKDYAVRHETKQEYRDGPRKMRKMHREILKHHNTTLNDLYVDHINQNSLDNRKTNLRVATNSQNQANTNVFSTNTSGYKGVCQYNKHKPHNIKRSWGARITINGKKVFKGLFETKEEAAKAYNELAIKYFGKYARLNNV